MTIRPPVVEILIMRVVSHQVLCAVSQMEATVPLVQSVVKMIARVASRSHAEPLNSNFNFLVLLPGLPDLHSNSTISCSRV